MHPLDKAEAFNDLLSAGWTKEKLSASFERETRTLNGFLRLARWPEVAKQIIRQHPDKFTTRLLFHNFLGRKWVDERSLCIALETIIKGIVEPKTPVKKVSPNIKIQQFKLTTKQYFPLPATLSGSEEKGKLEIRWKSSEEFDELISLLTERQSSN